MLQGPCWLRAVMGVGAGRERLAWRVIEVAELYFTPPCKSKDRKSKVMDYSCRASVYSLDWEDHALERWALGGSPTRQAKRFRICDMQDM